MDLDDKEDLARLIAEAELTIRTAPKSDAVCYSSGDAQFPFPHLCTFKEAHDLNKWGYGSYLLRVAASKEQLRIIDMVIKSGEIILPSEVKVRPGQCTIHGTTYLEVDASGYRAENDAAVVKKVQFVSEELIRILDR